MIRYLKGVLHKLLKVDDTPARISLAFAIGVFIAFSPLLGLHTVLGLIVAFLFRFSRLAMLAGVYTNSPWTLVPYYTFSTWFGSLLFPNRQFIDPAIFKVGFTDLWTWSFWTTLARQWEILIPFFAGSTILALVFGLLSYPLCLYFIRRWRKSMK